MRGVTRGMCVLRLIVATLLPIAGSLPAIGQSLDPSLLRDLQNRVGSAGAGGSSVTGSSPLDRARAGEERLENEEANSIPSPATVLKDEVQAAKLRRQLERSYEPTPIEEELRQRTNTPKLRQFGYDLFQQQAPRATPITGQIDDRYVLGIGDELIVILQGSTNRSVTTRVDREGRLVIEQLRPIVAAGRTLGAVRKDLEAATRATLLGTEVTLSVGSVRVISVLVGGEVRRPGAYALNSLADVTAALIRAGGIKPSGSLRQVRIRGRSGTRIVDLYGLLGIGEVPAVRLQDGDQIIVPALGPTVAVTGKVTRPSIFELRALGGTTVETLIRMAGGPIIPRGNDILLSRIDSNGREKIMPVRNASATPVQHGDAIIINARERGTSGIATLTGFVDAPGPRSLAIAPSVQALLGAPENLKSGVYTPLAALIRVDPVTRARQFRAVDLVAALTRGKDVSLKNGDTLVLFSTQDIAFMQSDIVRQIALGGININRNCDSLNTLATLVRDTQSDRFSSVIRGGLIVDTLQGRTTSVAGGGIANRLGIKDASQLQLQQLEQNQLDTLKSDTPNASLNSANTAQFRDTETPLAETSAAQNRLDQAEQRRLKKAEKLCPSVFEDEPDLLPFLIEHSAVIVGSVRKPGTYPVTADTNLSTLIAVAEGLTIDANLTLVEVDNRERFNQQESRRTIDLRTTALVDVPVGPGDDIRIGGQTPTVEPGAVLLTGEFTRPGLYTIRKGETLSELVERAGGVSSQAYPYGAVFTRRSVKQAQQEAFRRTARELSQALLAASARRNISGDSIASASQLANSFGTVEAPGRVVVEADPRVLAQRRDLDTSLEAGDTLYIPKRPSFVLATGDVLNPTALQYQPGKTIAHYLKESGGLEGSADKKRIFLVYPNGVARPVKSSLFRQTTLAIPPGSTIVVPKNIDPLEKLDTIRDVASIIGQFAVSLASIAVIAR